jgi:hypothetical protein
VQCMFIRGRIMSGIVMHLGRAHCNNQLSSLQGVAPYGTAEQSISILIE